MHTDPFYNSKAWRRCSKAYLAAHPLCRACEVQGVVRAATQVDHIVPLHQNPAPLDWEGLQPLCSKHHGMKTLLVEGKGQTYQEPGCDASGTPRDAHHWWRQLA